MSKREFLLLAKEYGPRINISGWWMSVKLDGQRAYWDGGISRGLDAREVPYANTAKDDRLVTRPIATGLWSRYGKVIHAPDWWLDGLPKMVTLDMELWMGNQTFQKLRSIAGTHMGSEEWRGIVGHAIDSPSWSAVLQDGEIKNANWNAYLDRSMLAWVEKRTRDYMKLDHAYFHPGFGQPDEAFRRLRELWSGSKSWQPMEQVRLPQNLAEARAKVDEALNIVAANHGEGLILRSPTSPWVPNRVDWLLKVKKLSDAEGTVTGFTWGRKTDKASRHLGRMGALVVQAHTGVRLELSGFTDEEREVRLASEDANDRQRDYVHAEVDVESDAGTRTERRLVPVESIQREGKDASHLFVPAHFPIGSKVTYTFRDLSEDKVPKEARYLRKRGEE